MFAENRNRIASRKKIIDIIWKEPITHKELVLQSGVPERTVDRILREFKTYGLFKKRGDGKWAWYEHVKKYRNRYEHELFLKHSKKLSFALEALLADEINLWLPQEEPYASKVENAMKNMKFAEEHLRTGYPEINRKLAQVRDGIHKLKDKGLNYLHGWKRVQYEGLANSDLSPEVVKELQKFLALYEELSGNIQLLILKIEMGEPLSGKCSLCPKVKVED